MDRRIDLNADLGESYGAWTMGDDVAMLAIVTSANIACGFHGGDPLTLRRAIAAAAERGVVIGAHIGYHDLVGFGRRAIDIEPAALAADVLYQIAALDGMCRSIGTAVRYVKPHGALFHRVATDRPQAEAVLDGVRAYDPTLPLLGATTGDLAELARAAGTTVFGECFADRTYMPDGVTLTPRTQPGAVLHEVADVTVQALRLVSTGRFASICVHGDTPGAVGFARAVRSTFEAEGYTLGSFLS